ncbi:HD domain-containing protein [Aurantiacibacter flavus]|uniref:HD domain-containing protein n=1 Tax=Aurantiacibacter flavus TaxID=3145232 RepID=A0ABV0CV87_9SPHN
MTKTDRASVAAEAIALFTRLGTLHYGEKVSQLDHALQCAHNARLAGEGAAMIAAALLHDIGHLLHHEGEDAATRGIDTRHEITGADWLRERFGPEVSEPVRLHVDAKRYLALRQPTYVASLSPASLESLELQGGAMDEAEATRFEQEPHHAAALRLRDYDDLGKKDRDDLPAFESYHDMLVRLARQG